MGLIISLKNYNYRRRVVATYLNEIDVLRTKVVVLILHFARILPFSGNNSKKTSTSNQITTCFQITGNFFLFSINSLKIFPISQSVIQFFKTLSSVENKIDVTGHG